MHAQPEPTDRAEIAKLAAAVEDALAAAMPTRYDNPDLPSHKDGPQIGTTPPVAQPDSRIVPRWALGLAVGSIGVGAGSIGLGCAIWLACKGLSTVMHSLSSVTLPGVLVVAVPFAGFAMVATAIGGVISKAKTDGPAVQQHIYNGPVRQETRTTNSKSIWNKNVNP